MLLIGVIMLLKSMQMQTLGMLNQNLYSAPPKIAHNTSGRPGIEFVVEVWDPAANKYTQMLKMVQSNAIHFISNLKRWFNLRERVVGVCGPSRKTQDAENEDTA